MASNVINGGVSPRSVIVRKSENGYFAICSSHVVIGEGENFDAAYEDLLEATNAQLELARKANYDSKMQDRPPKGFDWRELKLFLAKLLAAILVFGFLFALLSLSVATAFNKLFFDVINPDGSNYVSAANQLRSKGMAFVEKIENLNPEKKAALIDDLKRALEQLRPFISEFKKFQMSIEVDSRKREGPATIE